MTKHFVYKTTNLVNGKYYIGKRSAPTLSGTYLGSGTALKAALRKYGRENFKREILKEFNSAEEAYTYEAELVGKEEVDSSSCYNLVEGGAGCLNPLLSATNKPCVVQGVSYISQASAANALGVSRLTVNRWVKGKHKRGRKGSGPNNYKVHTPKGVFPSLTKAALGCNLPISTLQNRLISKTFPRYYKA